MKLAKKIIEYFTDKCNQLEGIETVTVASSYRRKFEVLGNVDILITTNNNSLAMKNLITLDSIEEVISVDKNKATVALYSGIKIILHIVYEKNSLQHY